LYKYADIAYIGGGFGVGIHNILEAATFGKPIVFGEKYQKFKEAVDLINLKSAFNISDFSELEGIFNKLLTDNELLKQTSVTSAKYVKDNAGAVKIILSKT
jgi:3-deoxy-D-manno-octulosonic-acid transferase